MMWKPDKSTSSMEVYSSVQSQMKMSTNEYIGECDEDDHFYAELRKQILLLTAEDEDDAEFQENKLQISVKTLQQRFKTSPAVPGFQQGCYHNWSGDEASELVPTWLFNLWNSGNGTGVFIPQIVRSRTRYKPKRKNVRGRTYKPVAEPKS